MFLSPMGHRPDLQTRFGNIPNQSVRTSTSPRKGSPRRNILAQIVGAFNGVEMRGN